MPHIECHILTDTPDTITMSVLHNGSRIGSIRYTSQLHRQQTLWNERIDIDETMRGQGHGTQALILGDALLALKHPTHFRKFTSFSSFNAYRKTFAHKIVEHITDNSTVFVL